MAISDSNTTPWSGKVVQTQLEGNLGGIKDEKEGMICSD